MSKVVTHVATGIVDDVIVGRVDLVAVAVGSVGVLVDVVNNKKILFVFFEYFAIRDIFNLQELLLVYTHEPPSSSSSSSSSSIDYVSLRDLAKFEIKVC